MWLRNLILGLWEKEQEKVKFSHLNYILLQALTVRKNLLPRQLHTPLCHRLQLWKHSCQQRQPRLEVGWLPSCATSYGWWHLTGIPPRVEHTFKRQHLFHLRASLKISRDRRRSMNQLSHCPVFQTHIFFKRDKTTPSNHRFYLAGSKLVRARSKSQQIQQSHWYSLHLGNPMKVGNSEALTVASATRWLRPALLTWISQVHMTRVAYFLPVPS